MTDARSAPGARTASWRLRGVGAAALAAVIACLAPPQAHTQSLAPQGPGLGVSIADLIADASQRYGVPARWIAAVIRAESAFDPRATSPKGAMGLMQLMPDTWAALRARLGLGLNPYDPRDNVMAGARYLRDLYDQFGAGGFLGAYNAGPARYFDFVTRGRPLPEETRAYVAEVGAAIDGEAPIAAPAHAPSAMHAPRPGIFVALAGPPSSAPTAARSPSEAAPAPSRFEPTPAASALFVDAMGTSAR